MRWLCMVLIFFCSICAWGANAPSLVVKRLNGSSCMIDTSTGSGSGTAIDLNGHIIILTAKHLFLNDKNRPQTNELIKISRRVVTDDDGIEVGQNVSFGKVIFIHPTLDIALLQPLRKGMFDCVAVISSNDAKVGHQVYITSSEKGRLFDQSFTTGFVGAIGRHIELEETMPVVDQINIGIETGASGAAVFDRHGRIVGMVTAKYESTKTLYVPARLFRKWLSEVQIIFF